MEVREYDGTPGAGASALRWLGSSPFAGVLVLCVCLSLTLRFWWEAREDIAHYREQRFGQATERVSAQLQDRMLAYEELLQGASGLFAALPEVDAGIWQAYFAHVGFDARLRGTQFVGFARVDPANGDVGLAFVYPEGKDNLRAPGYRPTDDPGQHAALARARDTGLSALSARSTLPVESQIRVQPGFVLYLPVYRRGSIPVTTQERRDALAGYVLCALRIHDLLQAMPLELEADAVIDLYDGAPSPGTLLFTSRGAEMPALSEDRPISVGGRAWTLRVGSSPAFDGQGSSQRPLQILLGGSVLSVALGALVLSGARQQRRFLSAHQDLARSHARYLSLVDSVPGTAFRVGPTLPWHLEYVSDGIRELTGKAPAHWLGSGDFLRELVHPEDLARVSRVVAWATARGTPFEVDYRVRTDAAAQRWVRQRTRALRGGTGEFLGMSGVISDITHTRDLMDTLGQQRETLEQQVSVRTAELLLAKDAAEAASVAKSRFLSTMSHELRTPMNAVIGYATLLAEEETDPARQRKLERIKSAGSDLLALLNRVLDFARADAGTLALQSAPFELAPVLEAASERLRAGVAGRPIRWRVDTTGEVPACALGDARRIREVLLELVDNALEYTEAGAIRVELSTRQHGSSLELAFAVHDTGCGIGEGGEGRLFGAFEQADASHTRQHGGIGLGLALARHLVTLMGGSIGAEPGPEGGSTFWFTVRVGAQPGPGQALHWNPHASEDAAPQNDTRADRAVMSPEDRERLRVACAELSGLLRKGEMQARETVQTHEALLRAVLPTHTPTIIDAVECFDFEAALGALETGCREAGLDLK